MFWLIHKQKRRQEDRPHGKFTVSFHIKDVGAYEETINSVKKKKPLFIVVMKDERENLPGLNRYLKSNYIINTNFTNFSFWKKLPDSLLYNRQSL